VDVTFGSVADTAPEGFLPRRVHFTTLVVLDTPTKEGFQSRTIASSGFGTRDLPKPITGHSPFGRGHEGAFPVGRLDQVKIAGTNVEGWGWLRNDEHGRAVFEELALGIVTGTSIEMVDVKYKIDFTWPDEEADVEIPQIDIVFTEANIGATTFVLKPAFGAARGELEEQALTAAFVAEGDLEVTASFKVVTSFDEEITAATLIALEHDAFTVPEPETHQPFQVSKDGKRVSGHLGRWGVPHTGFLNKRVLIPRSPTNYSSYCKRRRYTDHGEVYTGPIVALGGHEATAEIINKRLADPRYAWADVVVTDGKIGPWVCGTVRSTATDEELEDGSASGISGHWLNGELYAVCSTTAEGFDVARPTGYTIEAYDQGEDHYLAASFGLSTADEVTPQPEPVSYDDVLAAALAALEDDDADSTQAAAEA
jgi:hypothetical protein